MPRRYSRHYYDMYRLGHSFVLGRAVAQLLRRANRRKRPLRPVGKRVWRHVRMPMRRFAFAMRIFASTAASRGCCVASI